MITVIITIVPTIIITIVLTIIITIILTIITTTTLTIILTIIETIVVVAIVVTIIVTIVLAFILTIAVGQAFVWDSVGAQIGIWTFNPEKVTGLGAATLLPLEEILWLFHHVIKAALWTLKMSEWTLTAAPDGTPAPMAD